MIQAPEVQSALVLGAPESPEQRDQRGQRELNFWSVLRNTSVDTGTGQKFPGRSQYLQKFPAVSYTEPPVSPEQRGQRELNFWSVQYMILRETSVDSGIVFGILA